MKEYDVVVIGAGPGGTSTAERCANHGFDVALYEKRQEIGVPVRCAEGFSANSIKILDKDIPDKCIAQEMEGAVAYAPNGDSVNVDYGDGLILERRMYDRWLAEEAARSGVDVKSKSTIHDLIFEDGFAKGVKGNFHNSKFKAKSKVVVDAGGVGSILARKAGIKNNIKPKNMDSGFQYEMVDINLDDPNKIKMYFGKDRKSVV